MHPNEELIRRYWTTCNGRDWEGFAATLAPDVVYEVHQTRERVVGREAYVRFNAEFPGDWTLSVRRVVADDTGGVAWTDFRVDDEVMTGLHFFTVVEGLIHHVDDFWPVPYEPPPGRAHLVQRW